MKCEMSDVEVKFVPKQIAITLETLEEAKAFRHLIGCWNHQSGCSNVPDVIELVCELQRTLNELPA